MFGLTALFSMLTNPTEPTDLLPFVDFRQDDDHYNDTPTRIIVVVPTNNSNTSHIQATTIINYSESMKYQMFKMDELIDSIKHPSTPIYGELNA
jgi:hypothetical protein